MILQGNIYVKHNTYIKHKCEMRSITVLERSAMCSRLVENMDELAITAAAASAAIISAKLSKKSKWPRRWEFTSL